MKCLLIDDDPDDQEIFTIALTDAAPAAILDFAADGFEALRMLCDPGVKPDFIFLDMNMPGMTGRQCLQELRQYSHLVDVPIVIFSTSMDLRETEVLKRLGAGACLTKPSSINELSNLLALVFAKQEKDPLEV